MPNLDGTGPQGLGTMTGRRRGRCRDTEKTNTQNPAPENKEVIYGLGRGGKPRACGLGQGRRKGFGRNRTSGK